MAKLKAHGYELLRIVKETDIPAGTRTLIGGTDLGASLTSWERTTISYRSDGHIMQKLDVRFAEGTASAQYDPRPVHSYGWKLYKKLRKDATKTIEQIAQTKAQGIRDGIITDWTIEGEASR